MSTLPLSRFIRKIDSGKTINQDFLSVCLLGDHSNRMNFLRIFTRDAEILPLDQRFWKAVRTQDTRSNQFNSSKRILSNVYCSLLQETIAGRCQHDNIDP